MRPLSLFPVAACLLAGVLAGCERMSAGEPQLVDSFLERSERVRCSPVAPPAGEALAVGDLSVSGDTALVSLYPNEREVAIIDRDLRTRRVVAFDESGPTGVRQPESATLVGDSLIYIADRTGAALVRLDLDGRDRGRVTLEFMPQIVRAFAGGVMVTPLMAGPTRTTLLYTVEGDSAHATAVPVASFDDVMVDALANSAVPTELPDGRLLVAHELLVPAAYRLEHGRAEPRRLAVPIPDNVRASVGFVPEQPITEADVREITGVVGALTVDGATGDVLYMTRTGRERDGGGFEKAIVRADADLRYRRSYLPDRNPLQLAYLPDRRESIIVDEFDRWFACPTP